MSTSVLLLAHLAFFAIWLGAHLAGLVLLWQMRLAERSGAMEQRHMVVALMRIERLSRSAFILMLPLGIELAEARGLFAMTGAGTAGVWLLAVIWLIGVWRQPRSRRTDLAVGIRTAQRVLMVIVGLLMLGAGALSLAGGPPLGASWLAAKFMLYGAALLLTFGIEMLTQPVLYSTEGDSLRPPPPFAVSLEHSLPRASALAALLYLCLLAAAWLGLTQGA
ncbi:MAG: hypothetical protein ACE5ED_08800 [Rhodothalassiaceae bacterium]